MDGEIFNHGRHLFFEVVNDTQKLHEIHNSCQQAKIEPDSEELCRIGIFLDKSGWALLLNEYSFIFYEAHHFRRRLIKTRAKRNEKYHRILDAAVKVFARKGFFQSTIAQVAKEAGVADGTIYLYFKNKDDILVQFFGFKTKQVFDRFRKLVSKGDNAEKKLKNLIRGHLAEFQNDRNMAVVYQAEIRRNSPLIKEQIRQMSKMYLDLVAEIVEQGQTEGRFRRDIYLGLVKRYVLGAVEEVINTWVLSGGKYDLESMAEPLADLLVRGIGVHEPISSQYSVNEEETRKEEEYVSTDIRPKRR